MSRTVLNVTVCLGLLAAAAAAQTDTPAPSRPRDMIRLVDGKILTNIVVVGETPTEVKIDTTGDGKSDRTLDQNDVRQIVYDQEPNDYRQAVALYGVSDYDKAIAGFRKAMTGRGRRWVKSYSTYYIAVCLARKSEGDPAQRQFAINAFEDLLKDANNRWRDGARYQLGEIYRTSGDKARAKTAFATLADSAHKEEMKLTASVGLSAILMDDRRPAEALKGYDTVVAGAQGKFPDLYVTATVGKAEAHTALGEFDKAAAFLQGVLKTSKNRSLRAKIHLALGDCYYAQAAEEAKKAETKANVAATTKNALINYLWVIVVYPGQKAEFSKSLYYAGECWKTLGDRAKGAELHQELKSKFPRTTWAARVGR